MEFNSINVLLVLVAALQLLTSALGAVLWRQLRKNSENTQDLTVDVAVVNGNRDSLDFIRDSANSLILFNITKSNRLPGLIHRRVQLLASY